jgi:hypothetical protein
MLTDPPLPSTRGHVPPIPLEAVNSFFPKLPSISGLPSRVRAKLEDVSIGFLQSSLYRGNRCLLEMLIFTINSPLVSSPLKLSSV